jgi:hypothetical protein
LKKTSIEQKNVNLGCGSKLKVGLKLNIFLPHPSFSWHREKFEWGQKKKPNLGLALNWDPSPSLAFFLFAPSKLLLVPIEAKMEQKKP